MGSLISKLRSVAIRFLLIPSLFPVRLLRLIFHFLRPILSGFVDIPQYKIKANFIDWTGMTFFYILDVFGIPEFYEILNELINWNIRDYNQQESKLIQQYFGKEVNEYSLRINTSNRVARFLKIAYVSFRQINFHGNIRDDIFIHELVHIWQFEKFGSIYIYFAWKAQLSDEGYDYGGIEELRLAANTGKKLYHFNFEQQAEIIQHYYLLNSKHSNRVATHSMVVYDRMKQGMEDLA